MIEYVIRCKCGKYAGGGFVNNASDVPTRETCPVCKQQIKEVIVNGKRKAYMGQL